MIQNGAYCYVEKIIYCQQNWNGTRDVIYIDILISNSVCVLQQLHLLEWSANVMQKTNK